MCSISTCNVQHKQNVKLFRFPSNEAFQAQWVKACNSKVNAKNARICSLHFEGKYFHKPTRLQVEFNYVPKRVRELTSEATPTLKILEYGKEAARVSVYTRGKIEDRKKLENVSRIKPPDHDKEEEVDVENAGDEELLSNIGCNSSESRSSADTPAIDQSSKSDHDYVKNDVDSSAKVSSVKFLSFSDHTVMLMGSDHCYAAPDIRQNVEAPSMAKQLLFNLENLKENIDEGPKEMECTKTVEDYGIYPLSETKEPEPEVTKPAEPTKPQNSLLPTKDLLMPTKPQNSLLPAKDLLKSTKPQNSLLPTKDLLKPTKQQNFLPVKEERIEEHSKVSEEEINPVSVLKKMRHLIMGQEILALAVLKPFEREINRLEMLEKKRAADLEYQKVEKEIMLGQISNLKKQVGKMEKEIEQLKQKNEGCRIIIERFREGKITNLHMQATKNMFPKPPRLKNQPLGENQSSTLTTDHVWNDIPVATSKKKRPSKRKNVGDGIPTAAKKRRCGLCGEEGHVRGNCALIKIKTV